MIPFEQLVSLPASSTQRPHHEQRAHQRQAFRQVVAELRLVGLHPLGQHRWEHEEAEGLLELLAEGLGSDGGVGSWKGVAVASHRRVEAVERLVQLAQFEATLPFQSLQLASDQRDLPRGLIFVFYWFGLKIMLREG